MINWQKSNFSMILYIAFALLLSVHSYVHLLMGTCIPNSASNILAELLLCENWHAVTEHGVDYVVGAITFKNGLRNKISCEEKLKKRHGTVKVCAWGFHYLGAV